MYRVFSFTIIIAWVGLVPGWAQTKRLDQYHTRYKLCLAQQNYSCAWDWTQKAIDYSQRKYGTTHPYYAQALERKASLYLKQQKPALAQALYEQVCAIYQVDSTTHIQHYPNAVYHLSEVYLSTKQYNKVIQLCNQAIERGQRQQLIRQTNYLLIQGNLATAWMKQDQLTKAHQLFQATAPLLQQYDVSDFRVGYGRFFNRYARCYWRRKQYPQAREMYQQNLQWVEANLGKQHTLFKTTLESLMKYYVYMVQNGEMIKLWEKHHSTRFNLNAFVIYLNHWRMTDKYFREMWTFFQKQSKFIQKIHKGYYAKQEHRVKQRFKTIEQKLGKNHLMYIAQTVNLAVTYTENQNYDQALRLLENVRNNLKDYDTTTTIIFETLIDNQKSTLYLYQGRFQQAQYYAQESLTKIHKYHRDNSYIFATVANNLANVYLALGNYKKAKELLKKAEKILEKPLTFLEVTSLYANPKVVKRTLITVVTHLSLAYLNSGQLKKSKEKIIKCFKILQGHEDYIGYPFSLEVLAKLSVFNKDYQKADSLYHRAMQAIANHKGKNHYQYAHFLDLYGVFKQYQKKYKIADSLYHKAFAINKQLLPANHYIRIGQLFHLATVRHQAKDYQVALSLFEDIIAKQTQRLFNNFDHFNEQEKTSFIALVNRMFHKFYHFSLAAYPQYPVTLDMMYNIQLNHKGSLLTTFLKTKQQILNSKNDTLIKIYRQWLQQKRRLNKYYSSTNEQLKRQGISLNKLEAKAEALEKRWVELANLNQVLKRYPLSWQQVQRKLRFQEAAIEMVRGYDPVQQKAVYLALIVTPYTRLHPHLIIFKSDLEGVNYQNYLTHLAATTNDFSSHHHYFAPIAHYLRQYNIKKIYFAPDGIYNQINLGTLRTKNQGYLYQQFNLQLLTSTRSLLEKKRLPSNSKLRSACFFGNPNFNLSRLEHSLNYPGDTIQNWNRVQVIQPQKSPNFTYNALGGTSAEVHQLANLAEANAYRVKLFEGNTALEENIKILKSPQILHIATHGYFGLAKEIKQNELFFKGVNVQKAIDNPLLRSGLVFSAATQALRDTTYYYGIKVDDGHLNAAEVANLNLENTDLVVLSACQTGQGQIRFGEGVYGLQRAFRVAGAKSILMSLWKVDDTVTRQFMLQFYQSYFATGNKRLALKTTRDYFRKHARYYHPYYWGAFVLIGQP